MESPASQPLETPHEQYDREVWTKSAKAPMLYKARKVEEFRAVS